MDAKPETSNGKNDPILTEFPKHTYAEWRSAAEALLKGRSFEKTLNTSTYEGFDLKPIYMAEDIKDLKHLGGQPGGGNLSRGSRLEGFLEEGWLISQELSAPTTKELNRIALEELANDQNELNFWFDRPTRCGIDADDSVGKNAGVCGASLSSKSDMETLLKDIQCEYISTFLRSGLASPAAFALFVSVLKDRGVDLEKLRGCIDFDPIGWLVETGESSSSLNDMYDQMADLVRYADSETPKMQVINIQGHSYHNGGGSSVQEIGAILATAASYLDAMIDRGLSAAKVTAKIRLSVSIGPNYFIEIAKLRALRILWNQLLEAYGLGESERSVHVHARTGLWNKTMFDPYVNMLRTTTEAFSAVVGGCDSLHVGCFDEILRDSDTFARRIARNTHPILADECGMRQVLDPSGGSWAVESLTDQMGRAGWEQFQKIISMGGIAETLKSGTLQTEIANVQSAKAKAIHQRRESIVGTNNYPNATEKLLEARKIDYVETRKEQNANLAALRQNRDSSALDKILMSVARATGAERIKLLIEAADAGATIGEMTNALKKEGSESISIQPILLKRAAEDYEKLRLAAAGLKGSGKPVSIHQLNIGPSRKYRGRADWTSAFFQVSGMDVINVDDYNTTEEAISALKSSGAPIAIITSDDTTYAELAEKLVSEIKSALPNVTLLLAGAPGENEAALKSAGLDDFIHVRVNNYNCNRDLLGKLGANI